MTTTSPHAVFLSYAREDASAARRLAEALRASGLEVWFDENELRGGDAWDSKIRRQINECALFVPLISKNTDARTKGYFRLEWKLAVEQTHLLAEGVPFIAPVVIDDTRESGAVVPAEFLRVQWTRLPAALPTPQFVEQIERLLNTAPAPGVTAPPMPMRAAPPAAPAATPAPAPTGSSKFPTALIAGLAAAVVVLVGYIVLRPGAKESPPPVAAPAKATVAEKSATPAAPIISDKSIAVLPFANLSDDRENTSSFCDGIHEDILTSLANIRDLRVISRTSVMEYRGTTKKIPQIARELGVAYILEGSVRRAGDQVRITGQLIRAATDEHMWAKNYDRSLTPKEIFAIQSALAVEIAGALQAAISPETQKRLERRPTENLAAYDAYLSGRAVVGGRMPGPALQEQEAAFQRAVDLDPQFAVAWGELAVVHARFAQTGLDQTPTRVAKADTAMAKALALEPESPEMLRLLGRYAAAAHFDFPRAIAALEQLTRQQPNDGLSWAELAGVEREREDWGPALSHARKATQLDSASVDFAGQLVGVLAAARHWDEAAAEQRRLIALRPGKHDQAWRLALLAFQATGDPKPAEAFFAKLASAEANTPGLIFARKSWDFLRGDLQHYLQLDRLFPYHPDLLTIESNPYLQPFAELSAIAYLAAGDVAGARTRLGEFAERARVDVANHPNVPNFWSGLAISEAIAGRREEALKAARQSVELSKAQRSGQSSGVWRFNAAIAAAWAGDKDLAFAELEQVLRRPFHSNIFTQGALSVHGLRTSPILQPLKSDPRWEALLNDPKNHAPLF